MIEVARIDNHKSNLSSYKATEQENRAQQLELLIEISMPPNNNPTWHPLIAKPFRYPPPQPQHQARFRPAYGKNVFYGSTTQETALYEYSFHFMKQRVNMKHHAPDSGLRTIFIVSANEFNSIDVSSDPNLADIMDKNDYSASHDFVRNHPRTTFIRYPSCRDPRNRTNIAILDINHLEKNPNWETSIKYFYDYNTQTISWIDYKLHINWNTVC